tara:strand:- start:18 stop:332 length:315 start_codon:yes stop_codon:yes gene_type:complete
MELDHPELSAACAKYVQARDIEAQMKKAKEEARKVIEGILEEFPDTKSFDLPDHKVTWAKNPQRSKEVFRQTLIDGDVDPELIKAADKASEYEGAPSLRVTKKE